MIGAQSLLKASQAIRSLAPARSVHIIAAPAKNKISKAEFVVLCTIFTVSNFAYPTWVLHSLSEKRKQK